jgi:hypothetical protein
MGQVSNLPVPMGVGRLVAALGFCHDGSAAPTAIQNRRFTEFETRGIQASPPLRKLRPQEVQKL